MKFSLDPRQNDTSTFLDLLRWIAAEAVCVGHALNFFEVGDEWRAPKAPYMQNIGVQVFFVLSGFLIAYALVRSAGREGNGLGQFVVDRFARIYSAFIPALIFIALVDLTLVSIGRHEQPTYVSWSAFFGTMSMLCNYPGPFRDLVSVPAFGSAGQLWSLALEFHIYLFVGGLFFASLGRHLVPSMLVAFIFSAVPLAYFDAALKGTPGMGLSYLWLMGFASFFIVRATVSARIPVPILLASAVVIAYLWLSRLVPKFEYDVALYPFLALAFLLTVLQTQRTHIVTNHPGTRNISRRLADYSFSLFLVHYTILYALSKFSFVTGVSAVWVGLIVSNIVAWFLAQYTECRHRELAAWLKRRLRLVLPAADKPVATGD